MEARSGKRPVGDFSSFIRCAVRFSESNWMATRKSPVIMRAGFDATIGSRRDDVKRIREQIAQFHYSPLISILLPVYNSNLKWLRRAILSVQKQLYPHWELCIVDDASTDRKIWPFLQKCARRDAANKGDAPHGKRTHLSGIE